MSFDDLQKLRELQARVGLLEERIKQLAAQQEKRPPLPPGPKTLTLKKANGTT
jgi:hypothetical protein